MISIADMEAHYPDIKWREPIKVGSTGDPEGAPWRYACRICVASFGLRGDKLHELPTDPNKVIEHINKEHAS